MILNLDHVAVLTANLRATVLGLPEGFRLDAPEEQPTEGTLEQYAHLPYTDAPAWLLLEALADGPYRRALAKRGPGLHHFGCTTDAVDEALGYFSSHGLLLHPISLRTYYSRQAVWMCRPGIPFLVELYQIPDLQPNPSRSLHIRIPETERNARQRFDFLPQTVVSTGPVKGLQVRIGEDEFTLCLEAQ